jgi:hypothetical protein
MQYLRVDTHNIPLVFLISHPHDVGIRRICFDHYLGICMASALSKLNRLASPSYQATLEAIPANYVQGTFSFYPRLLVITISLLGRKFPHSGYSCAGSSLNNHHHHLSAAEHKHRVSHWLHFTYKRTNETGPPTTTSQSHHAAHF